MTTACASVGGSGDTESPIPRQRSMMACCASAWSAPQMLHGVSTRRGGGVAEHVTSPGSPPYGSCVWPMADGGARG
eukprot:5220921-Prymnesium_polylepis.1